MSDTRTGSVTNFDAWKHAYAARAANLSVSEVRALFSVVSRPEVVSLAGGMPDVSALDGELIEQAFRSLMSNRRNYALQYGGGQGDLRLREQIQEIMTLDGVHGSVEDIMITTGSQHALELLADLFLDQGDVVLVEAPSYVGAVGIFRHKEAHIEHVFTDEDGISPEALAEAADLRPVLDLVAGDFTRAGADLRLTLPDAPMLSQMDPDAAAIIARNLFENALRHGTGPVTAALSPDGWLHQAQQSVHVALKH